MKQKHPQDDAPNLAALLGPGMGRDVVESRALTLRTTTGPLFVPSCETCGHTVSAHDMLRNQFTGEIVLYGQCNEVLESKPSHQRMTFKRCLCKNLVTRFRRAQWTNAEASAVLDALDAVIGGEAEHALAAVRRTLAALVEDGGALTIETPTEKFSPPGMQAQ